MCDEMKAEMITDEKMKPDKLKNYCEKLTAEVEELKGQNIYLQEQVDTLKEQIKETNQARDRFYHKVGSLKERCDAYEFAILAQSGIDPRKVE